MGRLNLGYTFYRNVNNTDIDFGKKIVERAKNLHIDSSQFFEIDNSLKITFSTTYPGLAIGLGYPHETNSKDDYKIGFLFDYTTGLPYIPGSSVKGAIRSMFPIDENDSSKIAFINSVLNKNLSYNEIYEIEKSIFGKSTKDFKSIDNSETKDIFYDGYISTNIGGYLKSDYITLHKNELKSPEPLKFLKIAPDTKITLQFCLKENKLISKEDRLKLYSTILRWTGLGAKTNVNYGAVNNIKYEYKNNVETNVKRIVELIEQDKSEQDIEVNPNKPEHIKIFEDYNGSTAQIIKKVLKKEKVSQEVAKKLAVLLKEKLMKDGSWDKKSNQKNKEYIENIING